ncbi:hypothetical protein SGI36_18090 [Providencia rettgeri]|uniref:hypothetical protein n=1 Tax=Providencia stuartii TaxID=588 RepID=UPI001FF16BB5|nr:hypothetical protein [Providencia stuartii]ELZ5939656.1 hypothetical protein [Providencia stuartii]MCK1143540.1 hypothetical protein [Providencia stuartii]HEM6845086.1 hypothetical protein [Providencia rettgeri]
MKTIFYTVCISSALLLGCDDATSTTAKTVSQDILRVQGLIYDYDRSVTLGGVLNHRKDCVSPTWETLTDEQERPLVVYKCQLAKGALQNAINHDLNNWYQTTIDGMTKFIPRFANAETPKTDSTSAQQRFTQVLQLITTLSQHDWSLLRGNVDQPYAMMTPIVFNAGYTPSEEAEHQLKAWNALTETLNDHAPDVGLYLLPWLNQTENVEAMLRKKVSELQQHNANALTQFKHQQNEGIQITEQYITDLKRAQQNAQDWSITQVFIWSLVNPEKPVLTHVLYNLEDKQGQEDFTAMMEKTLGRSARTDAVAWAYQGKLETPKIINGIAKALFYYQTQSFQKPDIARYQY